MTKQSDDGGPAFPCEMTFSDGRLQGVQTGNRSGWVPGISIRDFFAAAALQAIIGKHAKFDSDADDAPELICACVRGAYIYADAMLLARQPEEVDRG